jgi:uncharacterized alkaline shock family protein YloU
MKAQISNDNGRVIIDSDVIAKYAGLTAVECMGVVGMAMVSVKDGLTKLLKRESITKGVSIRIASEGEIEIDFHIITVYGINISTIADNLMHTVKYKVEEFTGLKVSRINVFVEGVRIID